MELFACELVLKVIFENTAEFLIFMQIPAFEQSNMGVFVPVHFFLLIIVDPHHTEAFGTNHFILKQYFENKVGRMQHFLECFVLLYFQVNYSDIFRAI